MYMCNFGRFLHDGQIGFLNNTKEELNLTVQAYELHTANNI